MGYILFLVSFLSLSFCYSKVSRRRVEIVAPTVFFFIMTILYFSGLAFSSFIYGDIFIILLSIGALIYLIYDMFKLKKEWFKSLKNFQTLTMRLSLSTKP